MKSRSTVAAPTAKTLSSLEIAALHTDIGTDLGTVSSNGLKSPVLGCSRTTTSNILFYKIDSP